MNIATTRVDSRSRFGVAAIAITAASLALLSFSYGSFAPAENLPHWMPWQETFVRLAASVLLAASVGLFFPRAARLSAFAIGAYQLIWAAIGTPPIVSAPLSIGAWYGLVEALTTLTATWILCAMLRGQTHGMAPPLFNERGVRVAQILFGLTCIFYGCSHFAYASYTATMVPHWLPGRLGWAYLTGLAHIAAGLAIAIGVLPRLAATLEAIMMSLFGLVVWAPSFFMLPTPDWAKPAQNQWSELVVNVALAAAAWVVALSLETRSKELHSR